VSPAGDEVRVISGAVSGPAGSDSLKELPVTGACARGDLD